MLTFDMPPTKDRYIAEIKNLLEFDTRPLCIDGRPVFHIKTLCKRLNGKLGPHNSCVVKNTRISLINNVTILEKNS